MTILPKDDLDVQALRDQGALRVFALYVGGQARVLFPGQTERDIERYAPLRPGEVVAAVAAGSVGVRDEAWCAEASQEQAMQWSDGFAAAVRNGDAEPSESGSFLLLLGETAVLAPIFLPIVSTMAALPV